MINQTYAQIFRAYAFTHPEMAELRLIESRKSCKYIAVLGENEVVTEHVKNIITDNDIFIDVSYNNIYEDFLKTSYIDEKAKKYFKKLIESSTEMEIAGIIDEVFNKPFIKTLALDADNVYIRVQQHTNLTRFDEVIRLE